MGKLVKLLYENSLQVLLPTFFSKKNKSSAIKIIILDVNYQRWLKKKEKKGLDCENDKVIQSF